MSTQDDFFRWENWRVEGTEHLLAAVLENLDAELTEGWSVWKSAQPPIRMTPAQGVVRQYRLEPTATRGEWLLDIQSWGGRQLRAGHMSGKPSPLNGPNVRLSFPLTDAIRFLEEGIRPAAERAGARLITPTPAELFVEGLPYDVRETLGAFGDRSRKQLPLDWAESEAWQAFVVTAYRSTEAFDRAHMHEWFMANGWPHTAADELTTQFFEQCRLLARYRDTLVIA